MKIVFYSMILVAFAGAGFVAGSRHVKSAAASSTVATGRKILYYHDPMHPAYKSDKPGIAPDCGMDLVPVYAGDGDAESGSQHANAATPGSLHISPEKQEVSGVRVAEVTRSAGTINMRLPGRVVPDERRVYIVNAGTEGFITRLSPFTTGTYVRKNQWVGAFATADMATQFEQFIVGVNAIDQLRRSGRDISAQVDTGGNQISSNFQQRVDRLRLLGVSDTQLDEVKRSHAIPPDVDMLAPVSGFVLARNVSENQKFDKGAEFYRVADLSRVWIIADVLNAQQRLRPGMRARITLPSQSDTFSATISEVLPQFDPTSRTLKVRLEVDNPGYVLRPDMFVDVNVAMTLPSGITVPADAILDSGLSKTVFVERAAGSFESRKIETGVRNGDMVQVTNGLSEGERIVVSGTFLVDSESRLNAAVANFTEAEQSEVTDPVCGMQIDRAKASAAGRTTKFKGREYYFCSDTCKRDFEKAPAQYVGESPKKRETHKPADEPKGHSPSARV